ncbi:MAG: MerR family transcriptional regulator [Sphaerochaeta sp.]|nr:MerR family transcriptional regulator [Sphaerochaeta sp.]
MELTVHELTTLSGVSARTLRYYDEIDLLKPARVAPSGYRFYGQGEVDLLQQILLYRELDFSLAQIRSILYERQFDREAAFTDHLRSLRKRRAHLDRLIESVARSLSTLRGETEMDNRERFDAFKDQMIEENEQRFGAEIRSRYGDEIVDTANAKLRDTTEEEYQDTEGLAKAYQEALVAAFCHGDPAGPLAWRACDLHRRWLTGYWPAYTKEYHRGLAELYVGDERFKANYEQLGHGCAEFFHDAIMIYCR